MKKIESINNNYIKSLVKLYDKKYREQEKRFLVEGYHLVSEAKKSNLLETVLITDETKKIDGVENILVTEEIIKKVASTKTPQNIIGVVKYLNNSLKIGDKILLIDDIQDPGNLGTLVRSSLGFNIDTIILSENSVDIYNDKFIRSTQGALFHVNIFRGDLVNIINICKESNIHVFGTSLQNGEDLLKFKKPNKYALILGNEGRGVKDELLKLTDKNIFIKINPKLESLNVAVAGSIIMHYFDN